MCNCAPAAVQLMAAGAFPCAPLHPTLAVDLRLLEFALNLFVQIAPNNTAFTLALERTLGSLGFQLDHTVCLWLTLAANLLISYSELPAPSIWKLSYVVHSPSQSHEGTF